MESNPIITLPPDAAEQLAEALGVTDPSVQYTWEQAEAVANLVERWQAKASPTKSPAVTHDLTGYVLDSEFCSIEVRPAGPIAPAEQEARGGSLAVGRLDQVRMTHRGIQVGETLLSHTAAERLGLMLINAADQARKIGAEYAEEYGD